MNSTTAKLLLLMIALMTAVSGCKKSTSMKSSSSTPVSASSSAAANASPLLSLPALASSATTALASSATTAPSTDAAHGSQIPPVPKIDARAYVLMDAISGDMIDESNSHERLQVASLTKLMTSYIVFDALKIGRIKPGDLVTVSEHAWRTGGAATDGSTSFLPVGAQVPVETLIQGMIVQSGNDAAIALAEHIAGNEDTFAQLMNVYAQRLGMNETHFANATGLPNPPGYSTAHDLALLSRALVNNFPQDYHYFSEKVYTVNKTTQHNRNGLLFSDPSVDGIKTGHTESAGFCLISSAKRNGMRLITVVMGTPSVKAREDGSETLLNYGFSFYESRQLFSKDQALKTAVVRKGVDNKVNAVPDHDIVLTIPRGRANDIQAQVSLPDILIAPLDHTRPIGKLSLSLDGKILASDDLYPAHDVKQAGIIGRTIDSIRLLFSH